MFDMNECPLRMRDSVNPGSPQVSVHTVNWLTSVWIQPGANLD